MVPATFVLEPCYDSLNLMLQQNNFQATLMMLLLDHHICAIKLGAELNLPRRGGLFSNVIRTFRKRSLEIGKDYARFEAQYTSISGRVKVPAIGFCMQISATPV